MGNRRKYFERIFVEEAAVDHPQTRCVLDRFNQSRVVTIGHYKDVFNRPRQEWRLQKRSPALILARRRDDYLYDASAYTPDFGHPRFFYNALALNCVYDCAYCYLQGMFPSANTVLFVNNEDYFAATDQALMDGPIYLALSYDTDLLAFEHLIPYSRLWIEHARKRSSLTIEIRTKSARYRFLRDVEPAPNVVLAWTLSPQAVIDRYEALTPSLDQRIGALNEAIADGWSVRICVDPILRAPSWRHEYETLVSEIVRAIDLSRVQDISLGVFRMNKEYLKNVKRRAERTDLLYYPYEISADLVSYPQHEKDEMIETLRSLLSSRYPAKRIFAC